MYMKWGYSYFLVFDLEVKVTEIIKYILSFSMEKHAETLPQAIEK